MKLNFKINNLIKKEHNRQKKSINLIASENLASRQILNTTGSILTNKYAEGLPKKRYYGGCKIIDKIELLAIKNAKKLFNAEWVNVQPHSGSQANAALMLSILNPGDKILSFNLNHGGHLSHGSNVNFSGKLYKSCFYGINKDTELIDWKNLEKQSIIEKPKLIICGASSYSRDWNYKKFRKIADNIGAFLMSDISHTSGLIAKGFLNNPFPYCHFVTSTTHKTLRGPRGGIIMMGKNFKNIYIKKKNIASLLDSGVFPGTQGGPSENVIGAKAIAFNEALSSRYLKYILQIKKNTKKIAKTFIEKKYKIISNGTDNHLIVIDLTNKKLNGKMAEDALSRAGIIVNKNVIPFDQNKPTVTSGIRIGTPVVTSREMNENDMEKIVELIDQVLLNHDNDTIIKSIKKKVNKWMDKFPLLV